jgi:riboflavin synthase
MFTGIIESLGIIRHTSKEGNNKSFWIDSPLLSNLKIDQSIAHNGVCLTIEAIENDTHKVTAVAETLQKTTIDSWCEKDTVNLERCLQPNGRLDGHFVQGHVDCMGIVIEKNNLNGSWGYIIQFPEKFAPFVIEKGSITVNGISLTAFNVSLNSFEIAIIPYTYTHTNLQFLEKNGLVNLEFDMVGKYIVRWQETRPLLSNL